MIKTQRTWSWFF